MVTGSDTFNVAGFKAYNQLTIVTRLKQHVLNGIPLKHNIPEKNLNFYEFMELLEKDEPIVKENARNVSKFHQDIINTNLLHSGDKKLSIQSSLYVKKAFELGLINYENVLISYDDAFSFDRSV